MRDLGTEECKLIGGKLGAVGGGGVDLGLDVSFFFPFPFLVGSYGSELEGMNKHAKKGGEWAEQGRAAGLLSARFVH